MTTLTATTTKFTAQPLAAILKVMELAQQRNTQPQPTINHATGSTKPATYTVQTVLQMMAMAQQRHQQSSL